MTNVLQFGGVSRTFSYQWWLHWVHPKTYTRPLLWAWQRATRGWADCDTWSMDDWLCTILPPALEHLRDEAHGHPVDLTAEEWSTILTTIANGFRAAQGAKDIPEQFITELDTSTELWALLKLKDMECDWKGYERWKEFELDKFREAMRLFTLHFWSLWD